MRYCRYLKIVTLKKRFVYINIWGKVRKQYRHGGINLMSKNSGQYAEV